MITLEQYFQAKPHAPEHDAAAFELLEKVNALIDWARLGGFKNPVCPNTGTQISGSKDGQGDGGFRLPDATAGAHGSSHKEGKGVDVYDPGNVLDHMITDEDLIHFELYREHPDDTLGWCHLTTRAPGSGKRTFYP